MQEENLETQFNSLVKCVDRQDNIYIYESDYSGVLMLISLLKNIGCKSLSPSNPYIEKKSTHVEHYTALNTYKFTDGKLYFCVDKEHRDALLEYKSKILCSATPLDLENATSSNLENATSSNFKNNK